MTGFEAAAGRQASSANPVGVALVDVPHLFRAGLVLLLDSQQDMEVVVDAGIAGDALEGIQRISPRRPTVAVVGLTLTGERDSFWLIRAIQERFPSVPILASASHATDLAVARAIDAGASGFVDKDSDPEVFLDAVRRTARGESILAGVPDDWAATIWKSELTLEAPFLTPREIEVLNAASEGLTARQIGRRLGLRERTVTTHLTRIYRKLGADSRVSAITRAAEWGLVSSRDRTG
ncbi:MAG: LuxR C-terminal-related transcriptional regulator [Actinomycetota bacterium]